MITWSGGSKLAGGWGPWRRGCFERSRSVVTWLQTSKVSVRFDGLSALESVDLVLTEGNILGLVGPNGAGKTTLVNVMSGFQKPTQGELILNGKSVTATSPDRSAKQGVARTFQSVRLFRRLSVLDNVTISALAHHRRMAHAREAARGALAFLGLELIFTAAPERWPTQTSAASELRARWRCARAFCCSMNPPPAWTTPSATCWRTSSRASRASSIAESC